MRKVLLLGAYGLDNLGDDFMLAQVVDRLGAAGIQAWTVNTHRNRYYFSNIQYKCIYSPLFSKESNKVIKLLKCIFYCFCTRKKEKFSNVIFIGGGYTNEDKGSRDLDRYQLLLKKVCTKNFRCFFTGQTVGPAYSAYMKRAIVKLYRKGSFIYVREQYSQRLLAMLGLNSVLTGDDALLSCRDLPIVKENYAIFSFKVFPGYAKYQDTIFRFYYSLAKMLGCPIYILPFRSDKNDVEFSLNYDLYLHLQNRGVKASFFFSREITRVEQVFRSAKYVVGSAYHSIALGLINEANVYAIYSGEYYGIKMKGLLELYGLDVKTSSTFDSLDPSRAYDVLTSDGAFEVARKRNQVLSETVEGEWNEIISNIL